MSCVVLCKVKQLDWTRELVSVQIIQLAVDSYVIWLII